MELDKLAKIYVIDCDEDYVKFAETVGEDDFVKLAVEVYKHKKIAEDGAVLVEKVKTMESLFRNEYRIVRNLGSA